MTGTELIEEHRTEIERLCRYFGVRRLRLFGSALTDRWDASRSDLDFLVEYGPENRSLSPLDRLVGLQLALEELFGRKVDVVNWATARNRYFRQSAEQLTREVYAA